MAPTLVKLYTALPSSKSYLRSFIEAGTCAAHMIALALVIYWRGILKEWTIIYRCANFNKYMFIIQCFCTITIKNCDASRVISRVSPTQIVVRAFVIEMYAVLQRLYIVYIDYIQYIQTIYSVYRLYIVYIYYI